ncbi:MAG: hypothetical protein M1131_01035 [Actinobacteria bacterium]|nr:hypothetical protein [Actinomycetota bacterium]
MPWCDTCEEEVGEDSLTEEGQCPQCGSTLLSRKHIPWHVKVLAAGTVVYLGYRTYQGITWVIHHI